MKNILSFLPEARPPTIPWRFMGDHLEEEMNSSTTYRSSFKKALPHSQGMQGLPTIVASSQHTTIGTAPTGQFALKITFQSFSYMYQQVGISNTRNTIFYILMTKFKLIASCDFQTLSDYTRIFFYQQYIPKYLYLQLYTRQ
jgi:hypothetical protein